jgi:hypothetical protein
MDPLQTSYAATQAAFIEGMIPNSETPGTDISRNVESAAGIGFGKVAIQGTADRQIKVSAASGKFVGITVLDTTQLEDKYPQYATARVRTKGPVVVQASKAVAAGDKVYFVPATGAFTNTATDNTEIVGARWDTSTSGAGLAVVRLG